MEPSDVVGTTAAVAWAGRATAPVVARRALTGGWTSTLLALTHADGTESVLRLIDREPWRTHGAELATRESTTQRELVSTPVPAPRSLALDADGSVAGVAAHLMTLLPGTVDPGRVDDRSLAVLAETLAAIHAVTPAVPARPFQSWAWAAKHVVPPWAEHPSAWTAAFALLRTPPPDGERTFIHRDFHLRNVLWDGARVSGVVDWVETSTGPPWLDVAHAVTHLALDHGVERAARFAAAYTAVTGRRREPYWEVMDVVGLLPAPGGEDRLGDPAQQRRLEGRLIASLSG